MNSTGTLRWFKSSYSDGGGGDCLEVAYTWRKSTYSDGPADACVEFAPCPDTAAIHIRDSKAPDLAILTVSPAAWGDFLTYTTTRPSR